MLYIFFAFFSFNEFNFEHHLILMGSRIPSINSSNDGSRPKNLKRIYDKKVIWKFLRCCGQWPCAQKRKEYSKPLRKPHYEIYDCRPLRIQLYPREIHFIKLCRWSSSSTIEEALLWRDIILHWLRSILTKIIASKIIFVIKISGHIAVLKHSIII